MADLVQDKLAGLLRRAQATHHDFESVELGGERDEQWAAWYAEYLLDSGLAGLLGNQPDVDELSEALDQSSKAFKAAGSPGDWAAFTAAYMLEKRSAAPQI
jgi:hypothetical protein